MSKTPVVTSGDAKVRVASHLSKVPSIATEAFTLNLTVLCGGGEITKTGACARASGDSRAAAASNGRSAKYLIFINFPFPDPMAFGRRNLRVADSGVPDAGEHTRDQLWERTLAKMLGGAEYSRPQNACGFDSPPSAIGSAVVVRRSVIQYPAAFPKARRLSWPPRSSWVLGSMA